MTQPIGRDLDVAIAHALGWKLVEYERAVWVCDDDGAACAPLPLFHQSVDALLSDVVPECQRRYPGWRWSLVQLDDGYESDFQPDGYQWGFVGKADTPAEALALALLSALEES